MRRKAKAIKGVKSVVAFETPVRSGVAVLATDFWTAKKARDAGDRRVGRIGRVQAQLGGAVHRVSRAGEEARRIGQAGRRCRRRRSAGAAQDAGSDLRISVSRARVDGAAELRRAHRRAGLRDLERRAVPDRRPGCRRQAARHAAGEREASTAVRRRQFRSPRQSARRTTWWKQRRSPRPPNVERAGEDGVDARRRYARRLLPADVRAHAEGRPGQGRQASSPGSIASSASRSWRARRSPARGRSTPRRWKAPRICRTTFRICRWNCTRPSSQVPVQWWRSVGSTHTAFSTECFLDDIARATKQDPYALRRELLSDKHTRHRGGARSGGGEVGLEETRAPRTRCGAWRCTSRSTRSSARSRS